MLTQPSWNLEVSYADICACSRFYYYFIYGACAGFRAKPVVKVADATASKPWVVQRAHFPPEIFLRRLRASSDVEIQEDEEISESFAARALFTTDRRVNGSPTPRLFEPCHNRGSIKCPRVICVWRARTLCRRSCSFLLALALPQVWQVDFSIAELNRWILTFVHGTSRKVLISFRFASTRS